RNGSRHHRARRPAREGRADGDEGRAQGEGRGEEGPLREPPEQGQAPARPGWQAEAAGPEGRRIRREPWTWRKPRQLIRSSFDEESKTRRGPSRVPFRLAKLAILDGTHRDLHAPRVRPL